MEAGILSSNEDCISWVNYTRTPFGEAFLRVMDQNHFNLDNPSAPVITI